MSTHRKLSARALHPIRILIALALSVAVLPFMAGPAFAAPTSIAVDGDQDGVATDWEGLASFQNGNGDNFSVVRDPVGNADTTTFNNSESDYPDWQAGSDGTASGKSDIGNVYVYDYRAGADQHLMLALAWDRAGDTGTGRYYVELNQLPNQGLVPVRSIGDRRITIGINGADDLECKVIEEWTASGWGSPVLCSSSDVVVNSSDITDYFASPNDDPAGTLVRNTFLETVINLTDAGATTCPVSGFQSLSIRSQEGNENGDTSALKDRATGNVDIPSDCGAIVIQKRDFTTGELVTVSGTKFQVDPNPRAGSADTSAKTVVDNNTSAADLTDTDPTVGIVKLIDVPPGSYTVTELVAPAGYLLPPDRCDASDDTDRCTTKSVGIGETVTFSFKDKEYWDAPEIYKTATGQFDKSYSWTIRKTVALDGQNPATDDPNTQVDESGRANTSISQGGSATFDYNVTVVGTESTSSYQVKGGVRVVNPNDDPMTVTLTDSILNGNGGIPCSFDADADGGSYEVIVPASTDGSDEDQLLDGTVYPYTCNLTSQQAASDIDTNRATVTWSLLEYPQHDTPNPWEPNPTTDSTSVDDDFAFDDVMGSVTNETVVVSDTFDGAEEFGGPKTITFGEDTSKLSQNGAAYTVSWSYSKTFSGDPVGRCTEHPNSATVDQEVGADLTDTAVATVCVGGNLTISKNVVTSLKRSFAYAIDKQASSSTVNVDPVTGRATVGYNVVVTEGAATDSEWLMSGKITVTNPNNQPVTLTSITDKYGTTTCSVVEGDKVIPAENYEQDGIQGQRVFDYTCSFGNVKPPYDAANVAEIKWNRTALASSTDTASYSVQMTPSLWEGVDVVGDNVTSTMTKVNPTVTIVDNKTVAGQSVTLGTVTWSQAGKQHTFTYSLQLQGSAGRCIPYTNTARISETGQSDSAAVTVCWPVNPTVSKTATGTYDRTYLWAIDKEADQTSVETDGENGTEVNYTVTATPDGYVDDGWSMSGTITVSNPNDYQWMTVDIADVPNIGGGATCTVVNGDDVAVPAGTLVNGQIVPGTATRDYTCTIPLQPLYTGGTNTATITWAGGSASSGALPVVFAVDEETDDVVKVVDDKTVEGDEVELGDATWNDGDEPTVFTYSLDLEAPANECVDYVNTAEILETAQFVDVTVEACGPEVLPDEVIVPRPEPEVKGVETVLPDTGGPQLALTWAAMALLLAGGALIASSRIRRSRT